MSFINVNVTRKYPVTMRGANEPVSTTPILCAETIRNICCAPIESFGVLGDFIDSKSAKYPGRHLYIDRGSNVLGVAHLDSVQNPEHFWMSSSHIACPTLDNRLGAWILLHGLPSIGIYPDILLTENEEQGISTASDFDPAVVKWGWMFSFDRGVTFRNGGKGDDAVFYQYSGGGLEDAFRKGGIKIGSGSYSDISSLDHLGIEGVNVGCGMDCYHDLSANVKIDTLRKQLEKFAAIYRATENSIFPWDEEYEGVKKWESPKDWEEWKEWEGKYYYLNEDGKGGKEPQKYSRLSLIESAFSLEVHKIEAIYDEGFASWLDYPDCFEAWIAYHRVSSEQQEGEWFQKCDGCGHSYEFEETKWSPFFSKNYCKACYLEAMDTIQLMPKGWKESIAEEFELQMQGVEEVLSVP